MFNCIVKTSLKLAKFFSKLRTTVYTKAVSVVESLLLVQLHIRDSE